MSGHCNICGGWGHAEGICPQARPGSVLAREHGCTCEGGEVIVDGERQWWQHEGCPLHEEPVTVCDDIGIGHKVGLDH